MAKYDALRKIERNQMLQEYAAAHPELSLKEIGKIFNISESRVCRILKRNQEKERAAAVTAALSDSRDQPGNHKRR